MPISFWYSKTNIKKNNVGTLLRVTVSPEVVVVFPVTNTPLKIELYNFLSTRKLKTTKGKGTKKDQNVMGTGDTIYPPV